VIVDSFRFLPRSFRPFYEGRAPLPGEEAPVWTPFDKRLAESRIALLTSAGIYMKGLQESFDQAQERKYPEWGDPSWRSIPSVARPEELGVAHLHIDDEDILADPEIALPARGLAQFAAEGMIGGATRLHLSVMGYQEASLEGWRTTTAPELAAELRDQVADGLILAPA